MNDILVPVYGGMFDSTSVVETIGGFPRGNKAVDSEFFAKMIACFYKSGIFGSDSFKVTAASGSSGRTVSVAPGIAWINGYMAWLKEAKTITLPSGGTIMIALRLNSAAGEFNLIATDNTAGMPLDKNGIKDLVLATVTVPTYAVSVSESMITDTRADASKCGFVTSSLDALGSVANAMNADNLGGTAAANYLKKSGGTMTGSIVAAADATGDAVVRNISYGSALPEFIEDGDIFILVPEGGR